MDESKQFFVCDVRPKDWVQSTFLVKSKETAFARNGKPYLVLRLADRTGELDARVLDEVDALSTLFESGDVVAVGGRAHIFQTRLQLVVQHLVQVPKNEIDIEHYLPTGGEDTNAQFEELKALLGSMQSPWIRDLSLKLLGDPEIADRYKRCPAAKSIHHAFIGGLLAHALQLAKVTRAMASFYPAVDADLALFGAVFHDFGKIYELKYEDSIGYTDEGQLVGHIAIGVTLVDRAIREMPGFPKGLEYHLKHLILAHHGRLDYGSPKRPATLEAHMVHALDDMDSKLQAIEAFIASDKGPGNWTARHPAFEQAYLKTHRKTEETSHERT